MSPLVRRSLAPRGQTPILIVPAGRREKVSSIAGLSLSPRTRQLGLYFETHPHEHINNHGVASFLRGLLRHLRGRVIIVWDNGPMHKGQPIRDVLARYPRLHVEWLPPYAPELNPVEPLWSHIKYAELANFTPPDVHTLDEAVTDCLFNTKFDPAVLKGFFDATPLRLPTRTRVI
jgi:transposase